MTLTRALLLAGSALVAGCFHGRVASPEHTVTTWRAIESTRGAAASEASRSNTSPKSGPEGQDPGALDARQTYALAVAQSPSIAVAEARAEVAEASIRRARQLDNPQLRLTNFDLQDALAAQPGLNVGLRVPIPRPGTIRARVAGAELAAASQAQWSEEARHQLRVQIDRLFARMAMLTADRAEAQRAAEIRAARRDQIGARVESRVATRLDAALADVDHAEADAEVARIDDALASVHAELEHLAGASDLRFRVDPNELKVRDLPLDRDALTERAMSARADLRESQSRIGQAEADAFLARSKAWPWFDWAQVQYRVGPGSNATSFGVGVALTVPLFSLNLGEIKETKARVRQRELEERARITAVAAEIDAAIDRVERTARRVEELEAGLLPRVEGAAREAEAALAAGSLDPVRASDVLGRTVDARRLHLAALLEHREAVLDLEAAVGAPITGGGR